MLAGLENENIQLYLAEKTVNEGLSVRVLEKLAAEPMTAPKMEKPLPKPLPLELQDMENRMRAAFGLRAEIKGNHKKGKIILQYYSQEELERLYQCMEMMENM